MELGAATKVVSEIWGPVMIRLDRIQLDFTYSFLRSSIGLPSIIITVRGKDLPNLTGTDLLLDIFPDKYMSSIVLNLEELSRSLIVKSHYAESRIVV